MATSFQHATMESPRKELTKWQAGHEEGKNCLTSEHAGGKSARRKLRLNFRKHNDEIHCSQLRIATILSLCVCVTARHPLLSVQGITESQNARGWKGPLWII